MKIVILYTELADYTLACLRALRQQGEGHEILVVHFPVNPEAPFHFDMDGVGRFRDLSGYDAYDRLYAEIRAFSPEIIVCCGWTNKWYLRICRAFRSSATTILTLDNHWTGNLKQRLLVGVSQLTLRRIFDRIWIPGTPQREYARKLGFPDEAIMTGFYACDLQRFNALYEESFSQKRMQFPKRFLCVARYIPSKGYEALWEAFIRWKSEEQNDWELWCAGTGEQYPQRRIHPAIRHLGFVQKDEWKEIVLNTGVFVLPSLFEPWAVAVQEFAVAGYPLLLSDKVGAASGFLRPENGISFRAGDVEQIRQAFRVIASMENGSLWKMGSISHERGLQVSPAGWAETLVAAREPVLPGARNSST